MSAEAGQAFEQLRQDAERWRSGGRLSAAIAGDFSFASPDWPAALSWLACSSLAETVTRRAMAGAIRGDLLDPALQQAAARDLFRAKARNDAFLDHFTVFAASKGFLALLGYRLAHACWRRGERESAVYLQNRVSLVTGVDIHPAAVLGSGLLLDHATGIVIGETAVVEDDVGIWQGVCLGSTFRQGGDRHPKVRRGAILAAGAIILGNIEIGAGALVAAGSVVLASVPPGVTVAGAPARIVAETVDVSLVEGRP